MQGRALQQLAYLHDAVVQEIQWTDAQGSKVAKLIVICDEECERDEWAGRRIIVTFKEILLQASLLLGHVDGPDTFDSYSEELTPNVEQTLQKLTAFGIPRPEIRLRIALHSGSELQLACGSMTISVGTSS